MWRAVIPPAARQKQGKTTKYILGRGRDFRGDAFPARGEGCWGTSPGCWGAGQAPLADASDNASPAFA